MMGCRAPGMVAVMRGSEGGARWPGEPLFWMVMSSGVIAGFAVAYPVNVWMVARGMKHGLMTERKENEEGNATKAPSTKAGANAEKRVAQPSPGSTGGDSAEPAPMPGMDHSAMGKSADPRTASQAPAKQAGEDSHASHGGSGNTPGDEMKPDVTRPQLFAVTTFTALMLLLGMTFPAAFYNLTLSTHDVGGAIMPPGLIMDNDTPAAAMLDMAAVDPRDVTQTYGLKVRGGRELPPRLETGVKVFDLETSVIRWQILPNIHVNAYAFNGQVTGPPLRFRSGARVRLKNGRAWWRERG